MKQTNILIGSATEKQLEIVKEKYGLMSNSDAFRLSVALISAQVRQ